MFFTRFILINLLWLPIQSWADVYSFIDENGVTHYSDVADDTRYTLLMHTSDEVAMVTSSQNRADLNKPDELGTNSVSALNEHLLQVALDNQLDAELLHAVITVESAYNPLARSPKGALGLMQLSPATAKRFGVVDAFDPKQNISGGAKYLKQLLILFNNDTRLALAAYNSGENSVIKYGNKIPPYRETVNYVPRVMKIYDQLLKAKKTNI